MQRLTIPRRFALTLSLLAASSLSGYAQDLVITNVGGSFEGKSIEYYGNSSGVCSYNFTTTIKNFGTQPVPIGDADGSHPVIGQNLYRIMDGRIEQIGQGMAKHRIEPFLNLGDCSDPQATGGSLSPGCSETYGALYIDYGPDGIGYDEDGPKYQINPTTGELELPILYPPCANATVGNRVSHIEVNALDIDPDINDGAVFLAEAQVISAADTNIDNNFSVRQVFVSSIENLSQAGGTDITKSALDCFAQMHPSASITKVTNEDEGGPGLHSRIAVACNVIELENGLYRYEYVVQNRDSHQGIRALRIPADCAYLQLSDFDQHHVDYGCGEIWRSDDWSASLASGVLEFSTGVFTGQESKGFDMQSYSPNNAGDPSPIRWGTMSNFAFTATTPPQVVEVELGLFRPGSTMSLKASTLGPCKDLECSFERYCDTTPNSATRGAFMQAAGSASVSDNNLFLWSNGLPQNGHGFFFCGPDELNHPLSIGKLCVGGGFSFFSQQVPIVGNGFAVLELDLAGGTPGFNPNLVTPGSALNFQFYYRDIPVGSRGTWRLTDAMRIHFCQ